MASFMVTLVEEVINRSLTKLVREKQLTLIHGTRDLHIPSHIFYADDMMLFSKDTTSNINVIKNIVMRYAEASGQMVNLQIATQIGFQIGTLPFTYLAVPVFRGKPQYIDFQPLADKDMVKWMRNFIWSGDLNQKKLVLVAWHKLCKPFKEGGLGVRKLSDIKEAVFGAFIKEAECRKKERKREINDDDDGEESERRKK
ncbi:hypothetical protein MTR_6g054200 [Medicago truncatula]|uniref:Reverse transcriptase domain-containing protein n=1 Tax=Medicago truncatula TaxID=3880 RepID=A0A072UAH1_MEDTR|nr:hypothetical protein MTR_6g054200 [Medicago truncatula]